ncbi:hypothetical protein GUJ93_ZPchr0012g19494 [Zizania palustris]|uniref:Glutathione S-transferase n=1 Tax=Zizania palustris TaxID=103762 RepID=A0A8J5WQS1_ZIZPA|nr:hypothetical protein GUJ93_ZPchr0012g19494 [Zizania palustris]
MAAKEDLQLLGLAVSPFAIRVRIALNLKGVSYENLEQNLMDKSELLLKSNPVHKKVPVLIHGGKPICESLVILQYVDEVWTAAPSILPAEPYNRAVARFWAGFVDDKLFPSMVGILKATTEEERAAKVSETLAAMGKLEEAFAERASGKPFFGGDSIGYVDLALGSTLIWLEAVRRMFGVAFIDAGETPLLAAWAERFREAEAANGELPDADIAVEFGRTLQARWAAASAAAN